MSGSSIKRKKGKNVDVATVFPNYGEECEGTSNRRTFTMYLSLSATKNGLANCRIEV